MSVASTAVPVPTGVAVSPIRRSFGYLVVAATVFLIWWGAQVKSYEAGLSVPDWPMSYGGWWPTSPSGELPGNVFWEHLHRTIAAGVGLLTLILAVWTTRQERRDRGWVAKLALWCLAVVVVQGLLGGLTVKLLLPPAVSISHATLAQTFLCLVGWLAYTQSREWLAGEPRARTEETPRQRTARRAAQWATGAVFVQLILGACVRHFEAGLAVPFFPISPAGELVPAFVDGRVVLHLMHRGFAFVVATLVIRAALLGARRWPHMAGHALLLCGLVVLQIFLGATVVWFAKAATTTSVHVATGAVLLLGCWLLVLRGWRAARTGIDGARP